jgi:hypothetical protein
MPFKVLSFCLGLIFLSSCNPEKNDLYEKTDLFVSSMNTSHSSYGVFNAEENIVFTEEGTYQIMPVGRLINVKIMDVVEDDEYLELQEDLINHYEDDSRVNDVYICNAGTIMIDCRN